MRKSQREVKDLNEICGILERCQTIRLAMHGENFPYVVPLSFGFTTEAGKIIVYFHCAKEGKKLDLLRTNNHVCVEADRLNAYVETGHSVTADYESFIGFGVAREVFGEEAVFGLDKLLKHCGIQGYSAQDCAARGIVSVWAVEMEQFSAKKRFMN